MELCRYFKIIKRWWWLLIVGMIIPMSISYYFLSKQQALYQAKVTLMVGTTLQQSSPDPSPMTPVTRLAQAYTELVKRRPITQAVIQRLNLEKSPEELAEQITAWISPEAQLLEIMVTDTNPQAAAVIANALADELIRQSPTSVEEIQRQRAFVQKQLVDLELKITNIEEEIREVEDSLANLTSAAEIEEVHRRLSGLEAVLADYRATHASLSERLQSSANILTVVEPAVEPTEPVSGRSKLILPVAGAAGLALAAVFVILAECLASRAQDRAAGLRSKTGLFKRERLGRISAASSDKPYTITVKLYEGDELRASGEIRFHVADDPLCGNGSEEPDECDGPCTVRE